MRISDWSSDVCSSDLLLELFRGGASCPWVEESCKSLIVGKARMIVGIAVANTLDELRHGRQIAEMRRVSQVELWHRLLHENCYWSPTSQHDVQGSRRPGQLGQLPESGGEI